MSIASHGSGYVHPAIAVGAGTTSLVLNHPLPTSTLAVLVAVKVGGGNEAIVPVAVYEGSSVTGAPAPLIEAGGQEN